MNHFSMSMATTLCLLLFLNSFCLSPVFSQIVSGPQEHEEVEEHRITYQLDKTRTTDRLAIITSFPPEFYEPFIRRFKILYPSLQVQILNKKTTAALAEIQRGNSRNFDLFWSSSTDAFEVLKLSGKLKRSEYTLQHPTVDVRGVTLSDHDGYYFNFALSSVGFMWNSRFLRENNLTVPSGWQALTDPSYYGYLAMSSPSRSGTTHLIVEGILQGMGWDQGWAYLLKMSGNLATVTARSFSIPEGIVNGRFGIGLVIDFLAQGPKAVNMNIDFQYGEPILLLPAGIAFLKGGNNRVEAMKFLQFILSPEGQEILLDPTIGRLPILKDVRTTKVMKVPELLHFINEGKTSSYDTKLSRTRYNLVNNLFDQLITYRLLERRKIWKSLIELENMHGMEQDYLQKVKENVLSLLSEIPVSEEQSVDRKTNFLLESTSGSGGGNERKRKLLQEWDSFISQRFSQADNLLTRTWETLPALHE